MSPLLSTEKLLLPVPLRVYETLSLSGLLILELPTELPEFEVSARAAPLFAKVTASVLIIALPTVNEKV